MKDKIYETKHKNYSEIVETAKFMQESYNCGFKYRNTKNLFKYFNENTEKYKTRLNRSFPVNFMGPIVNEIVNSIFSKNIRRDSLEKDKNGIMKRFINNASGQKSLNTVMYEIAVKGSYSNIGVLIEGPAISSLEMLEIKDPKNVNKDIKEKYKLFPQVKIFYPERILNWSFSDSLNWVLLDYSYTDDTNYDDIKEVKKHVLWTKSQWISYEFSNNSTEPVIKSNFHNLGYVPFRFFTQFDSNNNSVPETIYEDIALQQRAVYNQYSLIDENFFSVIFPIILIQRDTELSYSENDEELKQKSNNKTPMSIYDNALYYNKGLIAPSLLKTDFVNVMSILEVIDRITKEIFRKVGKYLDSNNVYAQSGTAKEIDNEQRTNNLQKYSKQLEDLENWILETYCKYENDNFTEYEMSLYPKDFDTRALKEKIEEALNLKVLFEGKSLTATKIILKDVLEQRYGNIITKEERGEYQKELDEIKDIVISPIVDNE
ncbi:MAG: hypothetical protein A2015_10730 [Spirochaetes bacterium GWF1_31_7]|nr:MAG: hypothetical protein A2015_10730 [Spirochaetes bacterium GWF1_31_7]OHD74047.1 MAG: hypothetical protein A2355_08730 [Spirochaetes bacterium RIFOXYB1_FULL_32_8]HBD93518.1 hypothetical protein [Spirochaetia bacterium]HBI37043.1 hypothetical protein [Spirochaetia bacterium]